MPERPDDRPTPTKRFARGPDPGDTLPTMPSDPSKPLRIRAAERGDLPALLRCLAEAFGPYQGRYTVEAYRHTVLDEGLGLDRLASMRVLVAVDTGDRVVGTLSWTRRSPDTGHLRGMAVLPELHGAGVAQSLLDAALQELRDAGCRRVTLRTTDPLLRAVRFYERNGFRPSGTTADFHGMTVTERTRTLEPEPPTTRTAPGDRRRARGPG